MHTIEIDGRSLGLEDVERVARAGTGGGEEGARRISVRLSRDARDAVARSGAYVEELIASGERIYGVSTGFGRLAEVVISPEDQKALQRNLIRSHSAGVGRRLDRAEVRTIMLLRANALARGNSGCRVEVVERLLEYLDAGIHPVVPEAGSVGASGDLAPLAHVALALIGEGEVEYEGRVVPTGEVLRTRGLDPIELREKEGLALINGTQATTGFAILALLAAERAVETADVAGAMSLEGLRGTPEAFRAEVHEARPHAGQITSAARLRHLLRDSEIRESHRVNDPRIQDAYSLRCMPQVHGATRETLAFVRRTLETEANSATDNPLIFPDAGAIVSAGNFHAQVVSQALDYLAIAIADLAAMSERRTERLLNPDLSGLPAFLAQEPGIQSGFMIAQVTAVDLLSEMRVLAHPASVDTVPTSANQEDHISMGMAAGRKARRAIECLEYILGIELLCGAQALEFLEPLRPGLGVIEAHDRLRERVPVLEEDRVLSHDMEAARDLVRDGAFARIGV